MIEEDEGVEEGDKRIEGEDEGGEVVDKEIETEIEDIVLEDEGMAMMLVAEAADIGIEDIGDTQGDIEVEDIYNKQCSAVCAKCQNHTIVYTLGYHIIVTMVLDVLVRLWGRRLLIWI